MGSGFEPEAPHSLNWSDSPGAVVLSRLGCTPGCSWRHEEPQSAWPMRADRAPVGLTPDEVAFVPA